MRALVARASLLLLAGLPVFSTAQEAETGTGAKELFRDPYGNSVAVGPSINRELRQAKPPVKPPTPERDPSTAVPPAQGTPAAREAQPTNEAPADGGFREAKNVGLRYWIELVRPGESVGVRVTADRVFRSGERIRLHFQSNIAGYIALLQLGTHGAASLLFPDSAKGHPDNRIATMQDRVLPSNTAWFRFDNEPGSERLLVLFAQDLNDLPLLAKISAAPRPDIQLVQETAEMGRTSKNLVLEHDVSAHETTGTYIVNVSGGPVIFELLLQHS